MNNEVFILRPEDRSAKLSVIGVDITVLSANELENGQDITLQKGDVGMGPPPHSHDWDESFYVLKGSVEFICGNKTSICSEGTLVQIPAGTIHAFSFLSGGGEMLEITHKGRAIDAFRAIDRQIPKGPPDIEKVVRVFSENGVQIAQGSGV
ncbi:cupin domain-containing protein [Zhongshania sp.]|uniref:cupin domain-containing protein n=1 Tax=Zhongshania sp. TaxID=1971902 RepID=UPI0035682334